VKYQAVIEWAGEDYNGYVIELPGCVAAGETADEALANPRESASRYLAELKQAGEPRPEPVVQVRNIEVEVG